MVRRRLLKRRAFIDMNFSMATAIGTVCAVAHLEHCPADRFDFIDHVSGVAANGEPP